MVGESYRYSRMEGPKIRYQTEVAQESVIIEDGSLFTDHHKPVQLTVHFSTLCRVEVD